MEADERKPLGDVYPGERVTHNFMGIIYGGMCGFLLPVLWQWWQQPAGFSAVEYPVPDLVRWMLAAMAAGVFLSGCRDLYVFTAETLGRRDRIFKNITLCAPASLR